MPVYGRAAGVLVAGDVYAAGGEVEGVGGVDGGGAGGDEGNCYCCNTDFDGPL